MTDRQPPAVEEDDDDLLHVFGAGLLLLTNGLPLWRPSGKVFYRRVLVLWFGMHAYCSGLAHPDLCHL
jgi:hypothetical protein